MPKKKMPPNITVSAIKQLAEVCVYWRAFLIEPSPSLGKYFVLEFDGVTARKDIGKILFDLRSNTFKLLWSGQAKGERAVFDYGLTKTTPLPLLGEISELDIFVVRLVLTTLWQQEIREALQEMSSYAAPLTGMEFRTSPTIRIWPEGDGCLSSEKGETR